MLTIEADRRGGQRDAGELRGLGALPLLVRIGLVVLVLGGVADVAAHLAAAGQAGHAAGHSAGHTPDELAAHLQLFVGMVLILLGVVVDGVRQARLDPRASSSRKGVS